MWRTIQATAGNLANRAGKLAVDVLDAGPPEKLSNHRNEGQSTVESTSVLVNDRLSALKARYKSSPTADASHRESTFEDGVGMGEAATPPMSSAVADGTEATRMKEQLESLKEELNRQRTSYEETLREQRFEWMEKMKQQEKQHQSDLSKSGEEIKRGYQEALDSKEAEFRTAKASGASGINISIELTEKQQEIDKLKQQLMHVQQRDVYNAFGLTGSDMSPEMAQLQEDYEELMIKCQKLEEEKGEMVSQEAITERDAFWQTEIKQLEASHAAALSRLHPSIPAPQETDADCDRLNPELEAVRNQLEAERNQREEHQRERAKMEEETGRLRQALQERDAVWQQELISTQTDQQELRTQYEVTKRELSGLKDVHQQQSASHLKLETEMENERELRIAAQSHVQSLQKSMMDMDSGASSVRHQLQGVQEEMSRLKQSYEDQFQASSKAHDHHIQQLQEHLSHHQHTNTSLSQRLEDAERECSRLEEEVKDLTAKQEREGTVDVTKLTYDLETTAENLRLAESRNSLLGHEVESLNQELEHTRHQQSITQNYEDVPEVVRQIEAERDSCKEQLKRLKQQMIQMQEDQEASLRWRMEAEVKLAVEEFKKTTNTESQSKELTSLQLRHGEVQNQAADLKSQLEQKDTELMNLQIALGEMTYHGEAAEKLRRDLRSAQEQIDSLKEEIMDHKAAAAAAQSAQRASETSADEAHRLTEVQRDRLEQLEGQLLSVKKELLEAAQKLRRLDTDEASMVDCRLVVQLLVAYLERRHEKDALDVMARYLGLTEQEKQRIAISVTGRSFLGSVAGGTMALVKGGMSMATLGLLDRGLNSKAGSQLAEEWVEFLTKDEDASPQEDPLTYLQKGMSTGQSFGVLSSEASASVQTLPEIKRSHPASQTGGSISSRSDGVKTPVAVHRITDASIPNTISKTMPGTMPSFKDFLAKQRDH